MSEENRMKERAHWDRKLVARTVVEHALRWSNNMLVDVLSNHGGWIPNEAREILRKVPALLDDCDREMRKG